MRQRLLRGVLAALVFIAPALALSACAAAASYAGVPLAPGAADPGLQSLAHRAAIGDKRAQYELGLRFEEGRGVVRSIERAKRLYIEAARDVAPQRVYVPQVWRSGGGQAETLGSGPALPGLEVARERLWILKCLERPQSECAPPTQAITQENR